VIAIAFGTINVVGGFLVTDRMLEMFKGKGPAKRKEIEEEEEGSCPSSRPLSSRTRTSSTSATSWRSRCSSTA